jgi:hypothetical protein
VANEEQDNTQDEPVIMKPGPFRKRLVLIYLSHLDCSHPYPMIVHFQPDLLTKNSPNLALDNMDDDSDLSDVPDDFQSGLPDVDVVMEGSNKKYSHLHMVNPVCV